MLRLFVRWGNFSQEAGTCNDADCDNDNCDGDCEGSTEN